MLLWSSASITAAPLDTNTIQLDLTQLIWSPNRNLADPNAQAVSLASCNFSTPTNGLQTMANELQLVPASPLQPGYYGVFLADGSNVPALQFQVTGVAGGTTPTTARRLPTTSAT